MAALPTLLRPWKASGKADVLQASMVINAGTHWEKGLITMNDEEQSTMRLSEATRIQLSVSSWLHVVLLIITIVSCYFGLQASISNAVQTSAKNTADILAVQQEQFGQKMQMQQVLDDLKYFRQQYNDDMNKYVRDRAK